MKETFKDGCFMHLMEQDGQLIDCGDEPLSLDDVKEQDLLATIATPATQNASIAS